MGATRELKRSLNPLHHAGLVAFLYMLEKAFSCYYPLWCNCNFSGSNRSTSLERLTAIHRSIVYMPRGSQYSKIRQNLYKYLEYLLILHRQIYIYIALNKDYQKVEKDIDTEEIRKEIVGLIKVDNDESVFEFYNVYFEATRINEKLEQLKRI
jgi:hypothetical protein